MSRFSETLSTLICFSNLMPITFKLSFKIFVHIIPDANHALNLDSHKGLHVYTQELMAQLIAIMRNSLNYSLNAGSH